MGRIIIVYFLFFIPFLSVASIEKPFFFHYLTLEDNLPHNNVTDIYQDKEGYMWFATYSGLARYDGYGFQHYPLYVPGENYILTNQLRKVVKDKEGKIWVWTEDRKKVYKMDILSNEVEMYEVPYTITGLFCSAQREIVLPTQKEVFYYNEEKNEFTSFFSFPSDIYLMAFTEDKKGNFYLSTNKHQIFKYNIQNHAITDTISLKNELSEIVKFLYTDENYLWAVDRKNVLYRYALDSGIDSVPCISIGKEVRDILDWTKESLLLGTFNGIFLLDKEKMLLTDITPHTGNKGELNHFSINRLFKDRQGILWVGTHSGGVNFHHELHTRFSFLSPDLFSGRISRVQEDKERNIWFATEGGGLLFYNPKNGEQKNYLLETQVSANHDDNIIKSIFISGDTIWCGTHRGKIYLFSITKEKFELYRDYGYNNILSIYEDSNQRLWIASRTNKGLIYIEDNEDNIYIYSDDKDIDLRDIAVVIENSEGNILLGTQQSGFYCYNPFEKRLRHISPENFGFSSLTRVSITGFYEDKNKNLWVTTDGNGLFCFDRNLNLKKDSVNKDIPDKLYYIIGDDTGILWITGSNQIIRFDPLKNEVKEFSIENGLEMKDFSIYGGGIDTEGKIYFPGSKGCLIVDTRNFILNDKEPEVNINYFKLYNDSSFYTSSLNQNPVPINLKYNHAPFTISYSALNYIFPSCNKYIYRMQGVDDNWIDAGNSREITYTKLPPGEYIFEVKAANNDGLWSKESAKMYISVSSPLWQRWWAYLLYFLILSGILFLYFLHRRNKMQLEHKLQISQLEQEKKEEIHKEKLRVFTQIAHEFKTPLTLILNPLEVIKEKTSHITDIQSFVQMVEKNSDRLLGMVNDLIELQKMESGKLPLNYSNFNFYDFVNDIFKTFESVARKRNINFSLSIEEKEINVYLDKEEIEKVFNNLLSNAFKFTPPKGDVRLSVRVVEDIDKSFKTAKIIRIEIWDNGVGFSEDQLKHPFEPFSGTVKDIHGEIKGSGVGLSITHSIILRHGGQICIQPLNGHGTCVQVDLPYFLEEVSFENDSASITEITYTSISVLPVIKDFILLVDDDTDMLSFLESQLGTEYKIYKAESANQALEILEKENISLLISDIMMPGINGLEFCKGLKESKEFCHLPVILLSAKSLSVHVEEGFNVGADAYITKPFKVSTLKIRIRNILAIRTQLRSIYNNTDLSESLGIKKDNPEKEFVEKCISTLKTYATLNNFDVEMFVKEVGMSRAAFYRKWKSVTSLSPAEAIRNLRLECAAELLKNSSLTATEIAYEVGFNNYTHFSSAFKSRYGVSPKEYKQI